MYNVVHDSSVCDPCTSVRITNLSQEKQYILHTVDVMQVYGANYMFTQCTCTVLLVVKFPRVSRYPTVSHGIPQITTGDIVSRQYCGNHPCLKISVIIPGRQPCPMVVTEIFRNGPYYHGTLYVPWEFVGHRGTPWDTVGHRKLYHLQYCTCMQVYGIVHTVSKHFHPQSHMNRPIFYSEKQFGVGLLVHCTCNYVLCVCVCVCVCMHMFAIKLISFHMN